MNIKTGSFYSTDEVTSKIISYLNEPLTIISLIGAIVIALIMAMFVSMILKKELNDVYEPRKSFMINLGAASLMGIMSFVIITFTDSTQVKVAGENLSEEEAILMLNELQNNDYDYVYFLKDENEVVENKLDKTFYTTVNFVNDN